VALDTRDALSPQRERPMNLIAGARWLMSLTSRRARRRHGSDLADMGTAFGLDAITTLELETTDEAEQREAAPTPSPFELRLHRRSTL
jgi:hypothetical protein